jgi:hypothetical protein
LGYRNVRKITSLSKFWLKIASEHNDKSIEESTKYFNFKVKPVELKEKDWVLMKEYNFLRKTKKLAETFKGPFRITKVHKMVQFNKNKTSKHDHSVNTIFW